MQDLIIKAPQNKQFHDLTSYLKNKIDHSFALLGLDESISIKINGFALCRCVALYCELLRAALRDSMPNVLHHILIAYFI